MRGDGIPGIQDKHIRRKAGQWAGAVVHTTQKPPAHTHASAADVWGGTPKALPGRAHATAYRCTMSVIDTCFEFKVGRDVHISSCILHQPQATAPPTLLPPPLPSLQASMCPASRTRVWRHVRHVTGQQQPRPAGPARSAWPNPGQPWRARQPCMTAWQHRGVRGTMTRMTSMRWVCLHAASVQTL